MTKDDADLLKLFVVTVLVVAGSIIAALMMQPRGTP